VKVLAAFIFFFAASAAWAGDWCRHHHVGLITVSQHISPARQYNEEHWGPYWRCERTSEWSWQLGWYKNSYRRTTFYSLINYVPIWAEVLGFPMKFGGSAGLGTGYAEHSDGNPKGGLSPILGGLVVAEFSKDAHVGFFFNTAVVAAIVEVRWR